MKSLAPHCAALMTAFLIAVLGVAPANAVSAYAANCARVIGIPVPDVNCSDLNGTVIDNSGGDQCDNPSHGMSVCKAGTKFIRYVDTFTRGGGEETVVTMMMCRKTPGDGAGSVNYSDIGVIQYNETKHAACWFSSTSPGQAPEKRVRTGGRDVLVYPSPSTEGTHGDPIFWGASQPEASCTHCHQNEVWLRTPFAMSVGAEPGKGYKRSGARGAYSAGDGNNVPDSSKIAKRGLPCSVGKPDWNNFDGVGAPRQVKVVAEAYDRKFPLPAADGPAAPPRRIASAGACTACHYFGSGAGQQNCGTFLSEFRTGRNPHRVDGAPFLKKYWMPPEDELARQDPPVTSAEQYAAYYVRALDALAYCCDDGHARDGDYGAICRGQFSSGDSQAFNNRPCAACPGCGAAP